MWFVWIPFLVTCVLSITGLVLLLKGAIGRRIVTPPCCRKCGYNLTGLLTPICPECGSDKSVIGVIRHRRERKPRLIWLGLLILVPLAGILLSMGQRVKYYFDGYNWKPTAWMLRDARSSDDRLVGQALVHLSQRLQRGELNDSRQIELKNLGLEIAMKGTNTQWWARDVLSGLYLSGQLTSGEIARLMDPGVQVSLETGAECTREGGIHCFLKIRRPFPLKGTRWGETIVWIPPQDVRPEDAVFPPMPSNRWHLPDVHPTDKVSFEQLRREPHGVLAMFSSVRMRGGQYAEVELLLTPEHTGPTELVFIVAMDVLDTRLGAASTPICTLRRVLRASTTVVTLPRSDAYHGTSFPAWGDITEFEDASAQPKTGKKP